MICRKKVHRVLIAAVGDHFCPFASEKLEEIQLHPIWLNTAASRMGHHFGRFFSGTSDGGP